MKKFFATAAAVTTLLSCTALPAFAHGHDRDDDNAGNTYSQVSIQGDNNGTINITNIDNSVHNNFNIQLNDIQGHWAEKAILDLVKRGILNGEGSHKFKPDGHVTRAEFAKMTAKFFNLKNTSTTQDFNDVSPSDWEFNYVEATKDYFDKYIDLNGGYDFRPNAGDTRQDVTVTLVKVILKMNPSITLMSDDASNQLLQAKFNDADQIAPALRPYVATAVYNHLIKGNDDGEFAPERVLTRGEAATLLNRLETNAIVVDTAQPAAATNQNGTVTGAVYGNTTTQTSANTQAVVQTTATAGQ